MNASLVFGFVHQKKEVADDMCEISRNWAQFENEHTTVISQYQRLLSLYISRLVYKPSRCTPDIKDACPYLLQNARIECENTLL